MADFAQLAQVYERQIISTASTIGTEILTFGRTTIPLASTAWPTANRAIYIPFVISQPFVAVKMIVQNGATASGNTDVGIYDDQGNQLVAKGSTAQSGTNTAQSFDITDTTLSPGVYYMACAMDGTTGTTMAWVPTNSLICSAAGMLTQTSAFALPATATFAAAANAYIPDIAITGRTLI